MIRTLTTEQLRALRDALKSWQDGYDPTDDKEQYEMFVTAETAVGELLANREAQPVAYAVFADNGNIRIWSTDKGITENVGVPVPLYTAPPAPAVVKLPAEFYSDEGIVVRLEQVMAALAVVGVKYERKGGACRAEMLAQPVSSGYKLEDGWIACSERMPEEGVVVLCCEGDDISTLFHRGNGIWDDGDFHSNITGVTHWMPLPAAPEGGNDHDTRR
ncbi:DUF551 domain-containing protein [Serratia marcescens]|uniref:DUF551 domain-containing protein n=1 Tax=Serratia marcescens TaxID=615 RepID=UPI001C95577F|nr:DUF551 domain-containing protein [Serratia marcescens]MBY4847782.1 DUF551 domain-containing protein [Serratia marcescens]MCH9865789.1 DUF551 domain-containing protein [Serratia marcescens]